MLIPELEKGGSKGQNPITPESHHMWAIAMCPTLGFLENHSEAIAYPECRAWAGIGMLWYATETLLVTKLHCSPVSFQVQFRVLVTTYKDLYGIRPGYLKVYISLTISAFSVWWERMSMVQSCWLNNVTGQNPGMGLSLLGLMVSGIGSL